MIIVYALLTAFSAFIFGGCASYLTLKYLRFMQIEDVPNDRSNHQVPVPRGGGIAITATLVFFLVGSGAPAPVAWAMLGVALISWLDDTSGVPPLYRLAVHIGAALLVLTTLPLPLLIHPIVDYLLVALCLAFWMNLFNFMDGIDGISGAEAIAIGLGVALLAVICQHVYSGAAVDGLTLAATCAAFLLFNWHPAKMFMGDVGSIPLGLLSGFLLCYLFAHGYGEAALILPAYYVADGGYTFAKRLFAGKKVWEAHSEHAYQQAVRARNPHDRVVWYISGLNIVLVLLAVISTREYFGYAALVAAYLAAGGMRYHLTQLRPAPEILVPVAAV